MSLLADSFEVFENECGVEQFVVQVPTMTTKMTGESAKEIFDRQPDAEGIVVMENNYTAGIIMRTVFFQQMGGLYGNSLYSKRPVSILMDIDFMKADICDNVSKIGIKAMKREQSKLYDFIVIFKNKAYAGIISIRLFLVELSKRNEAQISVLRSHQQQLLSAHEQEIQLRKSLEYQSSAVRNLLDHADQGFFWFARDLIIRKDYSYKCRSIFNQGLGDQSFLDLVTPYFGKEKRAVFQMAFDSYFNNNSSVTDQVYLMLLPSDCLISNKNIYFEYRRIESNGEKAVMVILNDVTERVNMEKAMEENQNRQRLIIKAFSCQAQIKQILEEFNEIFSGGYQSFFQDGNFAENLNELFRAVHTFKGDFAQYGFISTSNLLHEFEDALLAVINQGENTTLADIDQIMRTAEPDKMLEDDLAIIYEILGNSYFDQSEMLSIPKSKIVELKNKIESESGVLNPSAVLCLIDSLKQKNLKVYLEQYRDYLQYLADRMMKNMPLYLIEGDDIFIDGDQYGMFLKSLVHVFRNIIDHGIEPEEERLACGKEERGFVECKISRSGDQWFTLCISDDGQGINLDKIKRSAVENRICTAEELSRMTNTEISNLIFADHLSTKERANAISGRGMGMSAFQEACKALGGTVEISTQEKKGTSFLIKLPYTI